MQELVQVGLSYSFEK